LEHINERSVGVPLFLVPGAGLQSGSFRSLAALLPVPTYAVTWPRGVRERAEWPTSLQELAELILGEIQAILPSGPYCFARHSFGAGVVVEMTRILEMREIPVALVALLDPRSLHPIAADLSDSYLRIGLTESLALISQTAEEGARYAEHIEELMRLDDTDRDVSVRQLLSPAALTLLEHVHETSLWYAELLIKGRAEDVGSPAVQANVLLLQAPETWKEKASSSESAAEVVVRTFQSAIFQNSDDVLQRVSELSIPSRMSKVNVPGGHFAMLREPGVVSVALQLCHALVETAAKL
jgi:thioesterase domain-containing protein